MNLQELFEDILPIIQKAAPIICSYLDTKSGKIICAILGAVFNVNPSDEKAMVDKLSHDPDLFAKLNQLESTHADWIKSLHN